VSRYQKGKTNLDFYWSKRQSVAVASGGPYANVHIAPEINHASTPPLNGPRWKIFKEKNGQNQLFWDMMSKKIDKITQISKFPKCCGLQGARICSYLSLLHKATRVIRLASRSRLLRANHKTSVSDRKIGLKLN